MIRLLDHNRCTEKITTILTESCSPASYLCVHCESVT